MYCMERQMLYDLVIYRWGVVVNSVLVLIDTMYAGSTFTDFTVHTETINTIWNTTVGEQSLSVSIVSTRHYKALKQYPNPLSHLPDPNPHFPTTLHVHAESNQGVSITTAWSNTVHCITFTMYSSIRYMCSSGSDQSYRLYECLWSQVQMDGHWLHVLLPN